MLSFVLDVCVDVGLECECRTLGLTLSVELVMLVLNVSDVPFSRGGMTCSLNVGFEYGLCVGVSCEDELCANVGVVCIFFGLVCVMCVLVELCMRCVWMLVLSETNVFEDRF